MNEKKPLVSIVIITYNSSATIIETLESAKAQTYKNIELIVSDDCSKDDTVLLVKNWIKHNKDCFIDARLIESKENRGVCANANQGNKYSNGIWIKSIAGDDTLEPTAIEEYVKFCLQEGCSICFAKMRTFGEDKKANEINAKGLERMYAKLRLPTREQQYKAALKGHILPGPGLFYLKDFFDEIGGFNERYALTEEYDFELRVMQKTKIYFLDKFLVNWRIRHDSLCHSSNNETRKDDVMYNYEVRRLLLIKNHMYLHAWDCYLSYIRYKNNHYNNKFYKILYFIFSPKKITDKINSSLKK